MVRKERTKLISSQSACLCFISDISIVISGIRYINSLRRSNSGNPWFWGPIKKWVVVVINFSHGGQSIKQYWFTVNGEQLIPGVARSLVRKFCLAKRAFGCLTILFPPSWVSLASSLRLPVSLLAVWQQCDTVKIITNKSWWWLQTAHRLQRHVREH